MVKIDLITGFLGSGKNNIYKKIRPVSDESGHEYWNFRERLWRSKCGHDAAAGFDGR